MFLVIVCFQFFELIQNDIVIFFFLCEGMFKKFFLVNIIFFDVFFMQYFYYFGFCSNRGMVGIGYLVGIFFVQVSFLDEDILNCIVKYVFYVQDFCNVRWWNDYIEGFVFVWFIVEIILCYLVVVLFFFDGLG